MYEYEDQTFFIEPAVSVAAERFMNTRGFHDAEPQRPSCSTWHKPTTAAGRAKLDAKRAKARAARKQNANRRRKS